MLLDSEIGQVPSERTWLLLSYSWTWCALPIDLRLPTTSSSCLRQRTSPVPSLLGLRLLGPTIDLRKLSHPLRSRCNEFRQMPEERRIICLPPALLNVWIKRVMERAYFLREESNTSGPVT